jgi:hypothetical protein
MMVLKSGVKSKGSSNWLTDSMEQSHSPQANTSSASQEIPWIL